MYADLTTVTHDIFSIISHCVVVKARFSVGKNVIGWRQSKTTGQTLCETVIVREFPWAYNGLLAGDDPALDKTITENNLEMNREVEEWKLQWMAKVHDNLEMWQGSQNLHATQK